MLFYYIFKHKLSITLGICCICFSAKLLAQLDQDTIPSKSAVTNNNVDKNEDSIIEQPVMIEEIDRENESIEEGPLTLEQKDLQKSRTPSQFLEDEMTMENEDIDGDLFVEGDEEIEEEIQEEEMNDLQMESLIDNELNTEDQNVLLQSVANAEEAGFSVSFIQLPFEESKQERLERLQEDEYFDELVHISQTGVHQYKVEPSPSVGALSFNTGFFPAPSISAGDITYQDVYGENANMMLFLNYEWRILKKIGDVALYPEIGFSWATGNGRFEDVNLRNRKPKERYTLLILPISVGLIYRLRYWQRQFLVPFAVGGGSYFGLMEFRSDFQRVAFAGTPAFYVGGGVQFLLNSLSKNGLTTIDREFGINALYLVAEARQYIGLTDLDFSGFIISGGVRVDF